MADGAANIGYDQDGELPFIPRIRGVIVRSLRYLTSTFHSPPPSSSLPVDIPIETSGSDDSEDEADDGDVINDSDDELGDEGFRLRYAALSNRINSWFDTTSSSLYFRSETVGDKTFIVLAVFDRNVNLVIEVRMPLKSVPERKVADLMALVKGLEVSLALRLDRVSVFFCDCKLFRYVTGWVEPSLPNAASLVDRVMVLRKGFKFCKPFLVEPVDVKSAFEFAKTVAQIQLRASETGNLCLENCRICYDDKEFGQMFSFDGCRHRYCFSCMKKHVEIQFLCKSEARCPHDGCQSTMTIESCDKLLSPEAIEIIRQRIKESSIPFPEKVYCPQPRCSNLMSKTEVLEYTRDIYEDAEQSGTRKCMECHELFCINCRISWHYGRTCEDYMTSSHSSQTDDAKLNSLAKRKLWKLCLRCGHMVELAEGCFHIICRCGYEFCYTCGAEWKNKKRTCSCPIWNEHYIINNV